MSDAVDEGGAFQVDLFMASLRADATDAPAYFEILCRKFGEALGPRAAITHDGSRLHKHRTPRRLSIVVGDEEFIAEINAGSITCSDRHLVKGIALRTDDLALAAWLEALVGALGREAERSEATRTALEHLLA